jgi:ribosome maturation factor RimP
MINRENINGIVEEHLLGTGLFPVQVSITGSNEIHILIDGDQGVTVADCIALNRYLEQQLDREVEDYSLEVSSYGVGNPLLMPRQYIRNTGRLLELTTRQGEVVKGRITKADQECVTLTIAPERTRGRKVSGEIEERVMLYDTIERSIVLIEF